MSRPLDPWTAFDAEHPELTEDICDRIGEALIGHHRDYKVDGVTVHDVHQHDACNHTISGDIDVEIAGEVRTFGFVAQIGNWNGFDMREWGDDVGVYEPPTPDPTVFGPRATADYRLVAQVYPLWREQSWLQDMERSYNYDKHFAPGGGTERVYREQAAKRGLVPMAKSVMERILADANARYVEWRKLTPEQRAGVEAERKMFIDEMESL